MKKIITAITLMLLSSAANAEGQTAVYAAFENDAAVEIQTAMDVEIDRIFEPKTIETEDGVFECKGISAKGETITEASCNFIVLGKIDPDNETEMTFGPLLSEELYNVLSTKAVVRMGASSKTVANLQCSKIMSRNITYTCTISDVRLHQIEEEDS